MRQLAASDAIRPIGCTQSTEILNTAGVVLSGSLPPGCELATMYTAAVTAQAADPGHVRDLIDLLSGADQVKLRERAGFLDAKK
jgi:molybdate transport system substrate-binding protein